MATLLSGFRGFWWHRYYQNMRQNVAMQLKELSHQKIQAILLIRDRDF